ncbi:hypothetical protein ACIKT0_19485 [Hansschlegelia beijingensis]
MKIDFIVRGMCSLRPSARPRSISARCTRAEPSRAIAESRSAASPTT